MLGAAEEINLQLEDHLLNLQTMSGSRFVGRYAQKVRTWEKTLNLVVECLEVWYNVQRKWMYLESIFIGSEDIRCSCPTRRSISALLRSLHFIDDSRQRDAVARSI